MSIYTRVEVLEDSMQHNKRITTFVLEYPRFIHSELLTHRMLSRNSSSSRAIPVNRMCERLLAHPVNPDAFGKNRAGMQSTEELAPGVNEAATLVWLEARDRAIWYAGRLEALGVHKQWANRLLEPFGTISTVLTGTGDVWEHFFRLRCHEAAEPNFQRLAREMREALKMSVPVDRQRHLPFVNVSERERYPGITAFMLSSARCARVSYLTHEGLYDRVADIKLFYQLAMSDPPHESPLEHSALATPAHVFANYTGWCSFRKLLELSNRATIEPIEAVLEAL